jgi:thermopsin
VRTIQKSGIRKYLGMKPNSVASVKEERKVIACLLLMPLLIQGPALVVRGSNSASASSQFPFILPPGYFTYFPVDAFANVTIVHYSLTSNTSVSTAFMTSAQFQDFNSSDGLLSNSVTYQNGTESDRTLRVTVGSYDVLVYAYGRTANASLDLAVFPNNPLSFGRLPPPEPTGIASYGLTNQSGIDAPYAIASTDVIGVASVSSINAYNSTAESAGENPSGATLQLNSVLVVDEKGGGTQAYWCQNTPDFVTSASQVALADNVWNYSASGFLSNDSITSEGGGGYVSTFLQNGTTEYYYAYGESNSSYSLPLGLVLLINATAEPGTGVLVQFGAWLTGGTLGARTGTDWFDNVTIHDPTATGAYFFTAGNYTTPLGTFYDTELVFGGEGGGEATNFMQLGANLGLFYANSTNDRVNTFPSYFSFGLDTAEAADNVMVRYLGNGTARVSVGTPNYDYLGAASGSFSLASVESALGITGSPTKSSSSTTEGTTSTYTATSSASSTGSGIPVFPYQAAAVAVFVVLVLFSYLVVRKNVLARSRWE